MSDTQSQIHPVPIAGGAELQDWGPDDTAAYMNAGREMETAQFYRHAFDFLKANLPRGDYHEYGSGQARRFRMALTEARRHDMGDIEFHLFNAFGSGDAAGSDEVRASVEAHGLYGEQVRLIDTSDAGALTYAQSHAYLATGRKIGLAAIDGGRFETLEPVFDFLEPLLQEGSVIYVDGLFSGGGVSPAKGAAKAFLDWQSRTRWKVMRHLDVGWWGRSYIVYLGKSAPEGVL